MNSTEILIDNLKRHYSAKSLRILAEKINVSEHIVLNWSSGRTSPSIIQINEIAYMLGVDCSQLLMPNNEFNITTPIWKDNIKETLKKNMGRLKLEKGIHESSFYDKFQKDDEMNYRSFLGYVNGHNRNVNLNKLDKLAKILSVNTYELLESEGKM